MEQILLTVLGKLAEQGGPWLLIVLLIGVVVWQEREKSALRGKIISLLEVSGIEQTKVIAANTAAMQANVAVQTVAAEASRAHAQASTVLSEVIRMRVLSP